MTEENSLPAGWMFVTLPDIVEDVKNSIKRGPFGSSIKKEYFVPSGYKVYQQKNVIKNDFHSGEYFIDEKKFYELKDFELKSGDIVITCSGTIGKIAIVPKGIKRGIINQALLKIRLDDKKLLSEYFFYLFQSKVHEIIANATRGSAMKNISSVRQLKTMLFPLPPFPEQGRIVSKLEELFTKLDAGAKSLQTVKTQLQIYRQAVLKYAFEGKLTEEWRKTHRVEPASIVLERLKKEGRGLKGRYKPLPIKFSEMSQLPDNWVWTRVGQMSDMIQYGTSEKASKDLSGIPVLRMGNIQDGMLVYDSLKYFPQDWEPTADYLLEDGDVLFNRTNSPELVGKTAVYKKNHPISVFASYLIRIKVNKDVYLPGLLSFYINSFFGRKYISSVVSQQVGQANVNGKKLSSMPIPLIPLVEQKRIVEVVERSLSMAEQIQTSLELNLRRCEKMRQSILKMAFEGSLVAQDPKDEPAEKLLEHIKKEKEKGSNQEKGTTRRKNSKSKQRRLSCYVE